MMIVELVEICKLVKTRYESSGHDCWGNSESYEYKYVIINGKMERCFDGWYVIHDGEKVHEVVSEFIYKKRIEEDQHEKETGFKTPREHSAYLKGLLENKQIVAYEFHNYKTGHCYVDYKERENMGEENGYTKVPLYKYQSK